MRINDEIVVYLTGVGMKLAAICKVVSDYYHDDTKVWNDGIYPHRVKIEPAKIPNEPVDIRKTYHVYLGYKGSSGGYFGQAIRPLPTDEFSIFQAELAKNMGELEKWDYLNENQVQNNADDYERYVFVTGYNEVNLQISKKSSILGWARNSNYLSEGSLVFVFDNTNLFLDSCFKIISKSQNANEKIWADEIKSDKIIYPNRWKAELIQDNLKIPLSEINKISPFDKEPFQGLLRGNFPMPLNSPQNKDKYENFRNFLLDKLINYWIFIVSDQPSLKLSAEEIYHTRMNDMFWGLNENTPHRKHLKKGDQVVFCHGAKKFLGTAKLETDSFKLDEEQKTKFSHNLDFFKPDFGVMLSDIDIWKIPKEVSQYIESLSFIGNIQQYPVYFQGGIKSIKASDYHLIAGDNLEYNKDISSSENSKLFDDEALPIPSKEQLHNAYLQIQQKLLIDEDTIRNIVSNLVAGKNVLLSGPIGTGKTHLATMISKLVWSDIGGYYPEVYTATSTWTTQDVIGGIYPKMEGKEVTYVIQKGCVSDTVSRNWKQDGLSNRRCRYVDQHGGIFRGVWLVIDEFNRANIDGAFGEMITSLEHGNLKIPTNKKEENFEELPIPKDYRIIGTLNTFDKHFLFKLSDALKRRFAYIEILPPVSQKAELEKYYVLKRSSENLEHIPGLQEKISLIEKDGGPEIDRNKTDQDILRLLDSTYDMFSFIRQTKNLGTAILISIFRYVLVDSMLNNSLDDSNEDLNDETRKSINWKKIEGSLDNAFVSNIIPQLEGKSKWSLQCIQSFCCEQITEFLKKQSAEQTDFGKYKDEFRKLIIFLGRGNVNEKLDKFQRKQIPENEWLNYDPWKEKPRKPSLPRFKKAITELIEESEII